MNNKNPPVDIVYLPSHEETSQVVHEMFASSLPEEVIQLLVRTSTETNESVRRMTQQHMTLGSRFGEIVTLLKTAYASSFGDTPATTARAYSAALSYLEKLHRVSKARIRLYLHAYARFQDELANTVEMDACLRRQSGHVPGTAAS